MRPFLKALRRVPARLRRRWRTPSPEAGRDGPQIVVIGNCQARGVAQALRVLAPTARVGLIATGDLRRERPAAEAFARRLPPGAHVFAQGFGPGVLREGGAETLVAARPGTRLFPSIVFGAFHPDAVYVGGTDGTRLLASPLHTYHSAIALFGHRHGLPANRIVELYREDVFARLGYLDAWAAAQADLLAAGRTVDFDLDAALLRWARGGVFMHNINHPRLPVLGDLAAALLGRAGLAPAPVPLDAYLSDELLDDGIWPVYPPIAAIYGAPGSYVFKRRQRPGAPPELLDLERFVSESLALYRREPMARLTCHRIEAWSRVPDIVALFAGAR